MTVIDDLPQAVSALNRDVPLGHLTALIEISEVTGRVRLTPAQGDHRFRLDEEGSPSPAALSVEEELPPGFFGMPSQPVSPLRSNEFTCSRCALVHHRSQLAAADPPVCRDCLD